MQGIQLSPRDYAIQKYPLKHPVVYWRRSREDIYIDANIQLKWVVDIFVNLVSHSTSAYRTP